MFGGKKRKAVNAAVSGIEPLIRTWEIMGGLPKGFWADAYVLGFLSGCIDAFAAMATNGRLDTHQKGQTLLQVYVAVAPQHADAIADTVVALMQQGDPDFKLGFKNADKCLCVAYGFPGYEDDPDVLNAKAVAEQVSGRLSQTLGPSNPQADTGGTLMNTLFYDVVRGRLG